jgi:hypothetical protein
MIAVARVAPILRGFGAAAPTYPPALSVVDHANGSGATATVSALPIGTVSVVYYQQFAGDLGSQVWHVGGTVIGNGSTLLSLPSGHYFAYAASTLGEGTAISSVVYFVVTDGQESLHTRCLAAVQARICALALLGLPNNNVVVRKLPFDRRLGSADGLGLPAAVVSPRRSTMPPTTGTTGLDDVDYDVIVTILDRDNQEPSLAENLDRHLLWRQQIARAFRNQRLPGVPEVIHAAVELEDGPAEDAWKHQLMVSALRLRFTSREPRGFS